MAFSFSGRRRCNQHSQGNDKRELCQCSPIRHFVTPNPFGSGSGSGVRLRIWLAAKHRHILLLSYNTNRISNLSSFYSSDLLSSYLFIHNSFGYRFYSTYTFYIYIFYDTTFVLYRLYIYFLFLPALSPHLFNWSRLAELDQSDNIHLSRGWGGIVGSDTYFSTSRVRF